MAHGLRRVSYATCDPGCKQFCFLARQPGGHINKQYCHLFVTKTAEQVISTYIYIYIYRYRSLFFLYKLQFIYIYIYFLLFFFSDLIVGEACERHDRRGACNKTTLHLTNELRFSRRCRWK